MEGRGYITFMKRSPVVPTRGQFLIKRPWQRGLILSRQGGSQPRKDGPGARCKDVGGSRRRLLSRNGKHMLPSFREAVRGWHSGG